MKKVIYFFIFVFLVSQNLYASCDEDQIDINEASLEDLDKLYGIGPAKAKAIVDGRTFNSIEDLINVTGIGEKTLEGIKSQGLACVDKEIKEKATSPKFGQGKEKDDESDENNEKEKSKETILNDVEKLSEQITEKETIIVEQKPIRLVPQTIKTEKISTGNNKFAFYSLIGFCILLAILFYLRRNKFKNEFR